MATTSLGADAVLIINALTLTDFIDTVTFTDMVDSLDITTFGNDGHRKRGGLTDGSIAVGGVYDSTTNGVHDVLAPLVGTIATFDWRPEGTGSALPKVTGSVLVQNFVESSPVADIVRWTCALEVDGNLTYANQA